MKGGGLPDAASVSLFTLSEALKISLHDFGLMIRGRERDESGKRKEEGVDIPGDRAAIVYQITLCSVSRSDVSRGRGDMNTRRSEGVALQPDISVVC